MPVWLAPRARSGADLGAIRAVAFRTPRHQSLPVVRRLDDTVFRSWSEVPASGPRLETHRAIRRPIPPQTASATIAAQAESLGTRGPRGRHCSCRIFKRSYYSLCILRSRRAPSWPVAHGLSLCPSVASDRGAISGHIFWPIAAVGGRDRRTRTTTGVSWPPGRKRLGPAPYQTGHCRHRWSLSHLVDCQLWALTSDRRGGRLGEASGSPRAVGTLGDIRP